MIIIQTFVSNAMKQIKSTILTEDQSGTRYVLINLKYKITNKQTESSFIYLISEKSRRKL